jgi:phage FluMu protein Com
MGSRCKVANMFISQEEDDTQVYSVRVATFELLSVRRGS